MDGEIVVYVGAAVGVLSRIVLPWLIKRYQDHEPWDWNMAKGQILTGVLGFVTLLAANPDLPELGWQGALAIGLSSVAGGWGVADVGREGQKGGKRLQEKN